MRSPAKAPAPPITLAPGDLDRGQTATDTQPGHAPVTLPPARAASTPEQRTPGADLELDRGHSSSDARKRTAPVNTLLPARRPPSPIPSAPGADLNGDQLKDDAHARRVAVSEGNGHRCTDTHGSSADLSDALLLIFADRLNDIEAIRKATQNQLSALTRPKDVPGGKGFSPNSKPAVALADSLAVLESFEHKTELELKRALRAHPLGPWVERTVGIGEKQGARLIAAIGDPYMRRRIEYEDGTVEEARPRRGPAELWAYCGYAPGQKRQKGVKSNWNAQAKMRAYRCAESASKQRCSFCTEAGKANADDGWAPPPDDCICAEGGYWVRARYDRARSSWADHECVGCKGPCTPAHKHTHALHCAAKAILKDLWREARPAVVATPETDPPASASQEQAT